MKKLKTFKTGTFIRIPLADGSFGYGRMLSDPYIAFYDLRTMDPSTDLDNIESKPVLFTQAVRIFGSSQWEGIGERKLEGVVAKPVVRFMQDIANFRDCVIYDSDGWERKATPEECIGLERAAVWDSPHIEERLLDHFMGRPNKTEISLRVRLG